jgi:hypothetical protein
MDINKTDRNRYKNYLENKEEFDALYAEAVRGRIINKDLYTCVCGSRVRFTALKKHFGSIRHMDFIARSTKNDNVETKTNN